MSFGDLPAHPSTTETDRSDEGTSENPMSTSTRLSPTYTVLHWDESADINVETDDEPSVPQVHAHNTDIHADSYHSNSSPETDDFHHYYRR